MRINIHTRVSVIVVVVFALLLLAISLFCAIRLVTKTAQIAQICIEVDTLIQNVYDTRHENFQQYHKRVNGVNATRLSSYRLPENIASLETGIPKGFVDETTRKVQVVCIKGRGMVIEFSMQYGLTEPNIPILEGKTIQITVDSISEDWYITDVSGTFLEP